MAPPKGKKSKKGGVNSDDEWENKEVAPEGVKAVTEKSGPSVGKANKASKGKFVAHDLGNEDASDSASDGPLPLSSSVRGAKGGKRLPRKTSEKQPTPVVDDEPESAKSSSEDEDAALMSLPKGGRRRGRKAALSDSDTDSPQQKKPVTKKDKRKVVPLPPPEAKKGKKKRAAESSEESELEQPDISDSGSEAEAEAKAKPLPYSVSKDRPEGKGALVSSGNGTKASVPASESESEQPRDKSGNKGEKQIQQIPKPTPSQADSESEEEVGGRGKKGKKGKKVQLMASQPPKPYDDSEKEAETTAGKPGRKGSKQQQTRKGGKKGKQEAPSDDESAEKRGQARAEEPEAAEAKPRLTGQALARQKMIEAKRAEAEAKRAAAEAKRLALEKKHEEEKAAAEARRLAKEQEQLERERAKEQAARKQQEAEQRAEEEARREAAKTMRAPLASSKKKRRPQQPMQEESQTEPKPEPVVAEKEVESLTEDWEAQVPGDWEATLEKEAAEEEEVPAKMADTGAEIPAPEPVRPSAVKKMKAKGGRMRRRDSSESEEEAGEPVAPPVPVRIGKGVKLPPIDESVRLRSPVLCIMGHVDTGKTKLLDKIRKTNVQGREAGGITQQIGATFFPRENLLTQCAKVDSTLDLKVPGLLIIDTPGHASFNNLRKRGSSLCDIAILVVDIMHGLEPQTRESIGMLRQRKCPFVIALNKIDRMYKWQPHEWSSLKETMKQQRPNVKDEFETRAQKVMLELTEQEGLNCELYYKNDDFRRTVSVVPTSAITGEGIPDLLALLVKLTQTLMTRKIALDRKHIECTVLEVKAIEGLGTTIDVILIAGALHQGDMIVVCGMNGPIVTTIRALLTPHPMMELRVKGDYLHHEKIYAAMGVKISAPDLANAVAGTQMMVVKDPGDEEEIERLKDEVQADMTSIFKSVDRTQEGVYVVTSTLGSLEALLAFLEESEIPVAGVNIGTVYKLDVKKASTMRERGHEEYSVLLAFDVKIDPDAEKEAKVLGVTIYSADIIYHLFDMFTKHMDDWKEAKKKAALEHVVFPCVLEILPNCIFNKKDPLIFGVKVIDGELRKGTPLVMDKGDKDEEGNTKFLRLGKVESIEISKGKETPSAVKNAEVCIKLVGDANLTYGRHFDHKGKVFSEISRKSIDVMKEYFRDDLTTHKVLVVKLKKVFGIV